MKPLRLLLLDCRSALRRLDPGFEASTLRERIDDAILDVAKSEQGGSTTHSVPIPETLVAQQVAYAWQVAARELRFSHPELHAQLFEKVRKLLDAGDLVDPGVEIQRLHASQAMALSAADTARRELDDLRQALADAVPGIDANIPAAEATRLRMRKLIDAGSRGSGLPPPAHRHLDPADIAPSRAELQEVAEGRRSLTREEREWCVTEAMVLCGFTRTPVELLADGEPAIARILLEGQTAKN
jgi:hypothetical protein